MVRRLISVVSILAVLALVTPSPAGACSCMGPGPACQAAWAVDAVFVGQVTSLDTVGESRIARMQVLESFRGTVPPVADVHTAKDGGMCGFNFVVGQTYVIYARASDGRLTTGICSGTALLSQTADADLDYLRRSLTATRTHGVIQGTATRSDPSTDGVVVPPVPFAGARVLLSDGGRDREAVTGADGRYAFDVPPGRYELRAEVPDGLYAEGLRADGRWTIEVRDERACAQANFAVRADGRITGRIVDARGQPLSGMSVDLLSRRPYISRYMRVGLGVTTAADGSYEFVRVAPGTYVIAVDTLRPDVTGRQREQVYAPGVMAESAARQLTLAASERVSAGDLVVPAALPLVSLRGVVRQADGLPVAGARVYIRGELRPVPWSGGPVTTDAEGRFAVTVMADQRYQLIAEAGTPTRDLRRGELAPFQATSDLGGLEILLGEPRR